MQSKTQYKVRAFSIAHALCLHTYQCGDLDLVLLKSSRLRKVASALVKLDFFDVRAGLVLSEYGLSELARLNSSKSGLSPKVLTKLVHAKIVGSLEGDAAYSYAGWLVHKGFATAKATLHLAKVGVSFLRLGELFIGILLKEEKVKVLNTAFGRRYIVCSIDPEGIAPYLFDSSEYIRNQAKTRLEQIRAFEFTEEEKSTMEVLIEGG